MKTTALWRLWLDVVWCGFHVVRSHIRRAEWLPVVLLLALLTVAYTWPLVLNLDGVVPGELADPLLNAFLYDHVFRSIAHGDFAAVWNPPIFWPRENVLAMSECFLGTIWYGVPLWAITSDPIALHNAMTLAGLFLSALAASWIGKEITGSWWLGMVAGVTWGFAPFHALRPQHTQFAHGWGLPMAALGLWWVWRGKPWGWLVASVSIALQLLSCSYLGVYGGLMLLPVACALFFGAAFKETRGDGAWVLAAWFAFVAILFVPSLHYAAMFREMGAREVVTEIGPTAAWPVLVLLLLAMCNVRHLGLSYVALMLATLATLLRLAPIMRVPDRALFAGVLPLSVLAMLGVEWLSEKMRRTT